MQRRERHDWSRTTSGCRIPPSTMGLFVLLLISPPHSITYYLDLQFILYKFIFTLDWEIKNFKKKLLFCLLQLPSKHRSFKTTTNKTKKSHLKKKKNPNPKAKQSKLMKLLNPDCHQLHKIKSYKNYS